MGSVIDLLAWQRAHALRPRYVVIAVPLDPLDWVRWCWRMWGWPV